MGVMDGGVFRRIVGLWLSVAWMATAPVASAVDEGASPAVAVKAAPPSPAPGAVMPAAYYGMTEAPRGDDLLRQVMLDAHNGERAALGIAPLVWDPALAADAARHAAHMAVTGRFVHSVKATRDIPASGENMWMGPRRLYGYGVMVDYFIAEKAHFRVEARLPDFSDTGRWQDVGHYTQMVWRGTRRVGCALGDGENYEYLVCRYFPAGNNFGKNPLDPDDAPPTMATSGVGADAGQAVGGG